MGEGRHGRSLTLGQVLEARRPGSGPAWAGREPGRRSASRPSPLFHCLLEHGPFFVTPATYVLSTGAKGRCPQPCSSLVHTSALTRHLMHDKRQYQWPYQQGAATELAHPPCKMKMQALVLRVLRLKPGQQGVRQRAGPLSTSLGLSLGHTDTCSSWLTARLNQRWVLQARGLLGEN